MELNKIFKMTQNELLDTLPVILAQNGYRHCDIVCNCDYIFAKGDIPVLLVAHLDTVHQSMPDDCTLVINKNIISSPATGLGADDRAGVYSILQLTDYKPYILFTTDEEVGRLGAQKACEKISNPDIKFIIEFDRKGSNDCVFYGCKNIEFIEYIEGFGFNTETGSYSDISSICPAWDIAGVNLSIGYYNAHRKVEYLNVDEMFGTIERVKKMFLNLPAKKFGYMY